MRPSAIILAFAGVIALASCNPMPPLPPAVPPVEIQRVEIAVPVPCAPKLDPRPSIPSKADILGAPDHFERTKKLTQAYVLLSARNDELEAAIAACGK